MRWCWMSGFAAALLAGSVHAQGAPGAQCRAAIPGNQPLANRSATIASMEQLPESCLKEILVACNDSANQTILDLGSAALCSMSYEALLRKGFGGSFHAMIMWWQQEQGERTMH